MKRVMPVGLIFSVVIGAGCTPNDPKAKMRDSARRYNEATALIATVKDAQSLEAAKPKLMKFFAWLRENEKETQPKTQGNRKPTDEELKKAFGEAEKVMDSPEFKEMMDAIGRYMGEVMRCQLEVPAFRDFYRQEMPHHMSSGR
jgi:hypothetical protein